MSYPHHHQANEVLLDTLIEGLEPNTKIFPDSLPIGQDLEKTYAELYTLLNKISRGNTELKGNGMKVVVQECEGVLEIGDVMPWLAILIHLEHDEYKFR